MLRGEFDIEALSAALDAERRSRQLSWPELVASVNEPFQYVASIPISLSTIRGMRAKRSVTGAVVLITNLATGPAIGFPRVMRLTQWLNRPLSSFVRGYDW